MTPPFTGQPNDALIAAHTSVGMLLGAAVWARPLRGPRGGPQEKAIATSFFLLAVAMAVTATVAGDFLKGVGLRDEPFNVATWLRWAVAYAIVGTLATRRWPLAAVGAVAGAGLWLALGYITESDGELAGAVLAYLGLLAGLNWRLGPVDPLPAASAGGDAATWFSRAPAWADDLGAFVVGTAGGSVACRVVLHGWTDSGDEWADTYQAALFAKLHAFGAVPHCSEALRTFWVFQYMGRAFAQYTPGWPLFMAPFALVRLVWLAGPASLGLLAAGTMRVTRRAAEGWQSEPRAAGRFAALVIVLSSTLLLNGGSRYPHVFVAALYVWSIESLLAMTEATTPHRERWGAALGACAGLLLATRPGDGATLGIGLFAYFVYALARRRVPLQPLLATLGAFGFVGALTLVVLRLQLGKWFVTGYSLTAVFYPWAKYGFSVPKANEYKWALTLATGAYCWWPCSPAAGLAGLAALRGRAQRIGFILCLSCVPMTLFYVMSEFGRGWAMGYGPRYQLPLVVPMAVGTGVLLNELWTRAKARLVPTTALAAAGPVTLALAAVVLGVVRIAPLVYPFAYADLQNHNRLHEAIAKAGLHDAVVFGNAALTDTDALDLPENLPLDLYDPDVVIAVDHNAEEGRCVRRLFPGKKAYRAIASFPVRLVPEP